MDRGRRLFLAGSPTTPEDSTHIGDRTCRAEKCHQRTEFAHQIVRGHWRRGRVEAVALPLFGQLRGGAGASGQRQSGSPTPALRSLEFVHQSILLNLPTFNGFKPYMKDKIDEDERGRLETATTRRSRRRTQRTKGSQERITNTGQNCGMIAPNVFNPLRFHARPSIFEDLRTDLKSGTHREHLQATSAEEAKVESNHKHIPSKMDPEDDFGRGQPNPMKNLTCRNVEEPWVGHKLENTPKIRTKQAEEIKTDEKHSHSLSKYDLVFISSPGSPRMTCDAPRLPCKSWKMESEAKKKG